MTTIATRPVHTCELPPVHTVALPYTAVVLLDGNYTGTAETAEHLHHLQCIAAKQRDDGKSPRIFWAKSVAAQRRLAVVKHLWVEYGEEIAQRRKHTAELFTRCKATTGNGTRWWRAWDRYQAAIKNEMAFAMTIRWAAN